MTKTRKAVINLKQILKNLNWLNVVQLALVTIMALSPIVIPQFTHAQLINNFANSCPGETGIRCSEGSLTSIFRLIINWALAIAFLGAVIVLIYGGFRYIFSAGNDASAKTGMTAIRNALIGIVIIVLSYVVVQIVYRFVSGQGTGAFGT